MFARLMGLKTISPAALQQRLQAAERTFVIDVNSSQSWAKAHVPGARNASPAEFTENDLPADKQAALVFYCSNPMCRKAPNAARRAGKMGYSNVQVLSAGISGWMAAGLATESATAVG
jgi:rhodanese-related sulfurtransferase